MGYCTYGWAFARGTDMSDTVVLTVAPKAEGSLYSVALELIMAPPRPTGSFVPAGATQVTVRVRATFSSAWRHATFTAPAVIGRLRRIVNGLPVDTGGRLGCAADVGASAMVTFTASIGSLSYLENPACVTVAGPDGAHLADLSWDLWRAAAQLTHVRVPSP